MASYWYNDNLRANQQTKTKEITKMKAIEYDGYTVITFSFLFFFACNQMKHTIRFD